MAANIDQDLYSRQLYVIGNQAMVKLVKSNVLLHGLGGLGIEIAKNLILAGVGALTILDNHICTMDDVGSQFYVNETHVQQKQTRAEASLEQLKNLNPYVKLTVLKDNRVLDGDVRQNSDQVKEFLGQFDVVVLTEMSSLASLVHLNKLCRLGKIKFLFGDVHGLFAWCFNDFNEGFEVSDNDGEEYDSHFVSRISNEAAALVEIIEGRSHNLQDGDSVKFSEINGMRELNGQVAQVKVINSKKFTINVDTRSFGSYTNGGIFKRIKTPKHIDFKSLEEQLARPELVISDLDEKSYLSPYLTHVGLTALYEFNETGQSGGFSNYFELVREKFAKFQEENKASGVDQIKLDDAYAVGFFKSLFYTSRAKLPTLCAVFGGVMAQEVIKSITNKFTPLTQWLHLEVSSLFEPKPADDVEAVYARIGAANNDRYSVLRQCFGGDSTVNRLKSTRLFMVGCGAIGCEMLKNYAMLGVGTDKQGLITITDNDLIEKSNLNRQFLFRKEDIQKSKSLVASAAIKKINDQVNIVSYDKKLCSQTETELFSDSFFGANDVCVNALDNVEARRYMDNRCVTNQKPLIESGTLGPKGHVQVILPFLTESYTSQQDPQTDHGSDVPYCTLKSFPASIEHCIEWARDKFESSFNIKPNHLEKFFSKYKSNEDAGVSLLTELIGELKLNESANVDGLVQACKSLKSACQTYDDCIVMARNKFEKYFSHKAKDLLYLYPDNHLMSDGTPFWKLPRRQPKPVQFDENDALHLSFIVSCAKLYANIYGIETEKRGSEAELHEYVKTKLNSNRSKVVEWRPNANKQIETDESKKKESVETTATQTKNKEFTNTQCAELIEGMMKLLASKKLSEVFNAKPLYFEKDDDSNGHIDYITATANLRAIMYSIDPSDRLHVKRIAGRIVPAIATTTSCISGMATIELIKIVQELARVETSEQAKVAASPYSLFDLDKFRNYFINLAISLYVFSEPGRCAKQKVVDNVYVTLWDKWTINGSPDSTLKNFVDAVKQQYNLTVSGVIYGTKPIYMPVMPGHAKRLNEKMIKLVKGLAKLESNEETRKMYADLFLTYAECDDDDDDVNRNSICPPIRYYFNRK